MRVQRIAIFALASGLGTIPMLTSAPAHATAVVSGMTTCDVAIYSGTTSVTADPGDTFTLNFQGDCTNTVITYDSAIAFAVPSGSPILNANATALFTVSSSASAGAHNMSITLSGTTKTIAVTVSGSTGSTEGDGPPSWWKAYQRATKETACNTGWNPSYAMWANNNSGGWVCVQELYYSGGTWLTR